ncbi:MAG TPA: hypothetical protein VFW83_01845 [Bryobacteraceae bacterium]|nr:hypothetical protein [Bryobacteraceae bacterium]
MARWAMFLLLFLAAAPGVPLWGQTQQDPAQKMAARLAREAEAFSRLAPDVIGKEALFQRALKPPSRFHFRVGASAKSAPPVTWQERHIVSEYAFAEMGGALHELRQAVSVDGRKIREEREAQEALANAITMKNDAREKELLQESEKYGLIGAATDFGQLILLFTPHDIGRYEFLPEGPNQLGADRALVFRYLQVDGPDRLTEFDERGKERVRHMKFHGEVWVRPNDFLPLRITLFAGDGEGADAPREAATVDYQMSEYGALLPSSTDVRELRGGKLSAENTFTYSDFHKFGASSEIEFHTK